MASSGASRQPGALNEQNQEELQPEGLRAQCQPGALNEQNQEKAKASPRKRATQRGGGQEPPKRATWDGEERNPNHHAGNGGTRPPTTQEANNRANPSQEAIPRAGGGGRDKGQRGVPGLNQADLRGANH